MGRAKQTIVLTWICIAWATDAQAKYLETMDPNGLTRNLQSDYGLVDDNAISNQSETLQSAIDAIAIAGGGRLIMPRGTYRFAEVYLKSNVHLLIEPGTVIHPYWPPGQKTNVFLLDAQPPTKGNTARRRQQDYIENVTMAGFQYYRDKPMLVPKDFRSGKWAQVFKQWKAERGIAD